jgi:hypothetical protein
MSPLGRYFYIYIISICRCSKTLSLKCSKNNSLTIQRYGSGSALSDPENKGGRQKGVNFDTLGSWNNRIDMSIMKVEKSTVVYKIYITST